MQIADKKQREARRRGGRVDELEDTVKQITQEFKERMDKEELVDNT